MTLLLTICVLHFVAQLTPGPDVLLIAKTAAADRISNSLKVAAGISMGIIVWVCLTLLGFTVLIQQWPWIQQLIMLGGGIFLAKMGYAMFKEGWQVFDEKQKNTQSGDMTIANTVAESTEVKPQRNYFLLGLYTNLTNPKTLIYFSSVFSLALSSSASQYLKLQLAIIIPIQTFATFSLLTWILSRAAIKQKYQAAAQYIDMISGVLFLGFAMLLLIDMFSMGWGT